MRHLNIDNSEYTIFIQCAYKKDVFWKNLESIKKQRKVRYRKIPKYKKTDKMPVMVFS